MGMEMEKEKKDRAIIVRIDDVVLDEWLVDAVWTYQDRDDETIQEIIARLLTRAVTPVLPL